MAAQSQEVALPGSASGLAPPAASEPVSSLSASLGNKTLLSRAGGLDNLGMVGRGGWPHCSVRAEEVSGMGRACSGASGDPPGVCEGSAGCRGLWAL